MSLTFRGEGPPLSHLNLVFVAVKPARDSSCKAGMLQLELEVLQCRRSWLVLPALARGTGTHPAVEFPQPTGPSLIYSFPSMAWPLSVEAFAGGALHQPQTMPAMLGLWVFYDWFDRSFD